MPAACHCDCLAGSVYQRYLYSRLRYSNRPYAIQVIRTPHRKLPHHDGGENRTLETLLNPTFIVFAPAENPEVAVCVVIKKGWHGYTGGRRWPKGHFLRLLFSEEVQEESNIE